MVKVSGKNENLSPEKKSPVLRLRKKTKHFKKNPNNNSNNKKLLFLNRISVGYEKLILFATKKKEMRIKIDKLNRK